MLCVLCLIVPLLAYVVEAGELSASAEGAFVNGAMMANGLNPGPVNGIILNGQTQPAQLVPLAQAAIAQLPGIPVGQVAVPLVASGALHQGVVLPLAQPQPDVPQLQAANGAAPLLVIVPQGNTAGGLQVPVLNLRQPMQFVPVVGNNVMQPLLGAPVAGNGGRRMKHSLLEVSSPTSIPDAQAVGPVPETRPASLAEVLKNLPWTEKPVVTAEESSGYGSLLDDELFPSI